MKKGLYGDYDRFVVRCLPDYYTLLMIAVRELSGFSQITDLGCGTGNLARLIFQFFPQTTVLGIDLSKEFLAIAKKKCEGYNFQPTLGDISTLCLDLNSIECAISSFTIHHLKDGGKQKFFQSIYQALKPSGIFINLDMVKPRNYRQIVSRFLSEMKKSEMSAEFIEKERKEMIERDRPASLEQQKEWLEKIGFKFELLYSKDLFAIYKCQKSY